MDFDESAAKALETIYGTRDVLRRRALIAEELRAAPGERILDVGCGPGFYVQEALERVGPGGSVAGVDTSAPMLGLARRRVEAYENVELREAGATALPYADGEFDAAFSVQVLEYVDDVALALREIHRVVRPGGRVVVWDVDWSTVSMHSTDAARTQRILTAWDRHLVHPALPRTLSRSLRDAGFVDVALTGHSFTTSEFTPEAYGGSLVGVITHYLTGLDDFPTEEAHAWAHEQWQLGEAGEFYFACVQCCVTATRAPG